MKKIIADNVGVWLAATIVAFLTIFSDKILERIRFQLNRADLRTKYFEELATDLSTYLFYSELFHERYQKGWADDPEDLAAIGGAINGAVTTLRKKEYVYRAWVRKYWGSTAVEQFAEVMAAVKSVDDAVHAFNDAGNEKEKTVELGKRLDTLRARVDQWLSQPNASSKWRKRSSGLSRNTARSSSTEAAAVSLHRITNAIARLSVDSRSLRSEIRPRKDKRGVDLISNALPFGRLWYGEPNAISNGASYGKFYNRSCNAVNRGYDALVT